MTEVERSVYLRRVAVAAGSGAPAAKLAEWRGAMAKLAALPQTACKLSMLGNVVPGWPADAQKEALLTELRTALVRTYVEVRSRFVGVVVVVFLFIIY